MSRKILLASALLLAGLAGLFAQTVPSGVRNVASMGGITEYDYPNGLKVLLLPDPAEPKITVNVTYLVGSRHEGYGETGMAHLLEHMNFIETTNGRRIKDELVGHGANWNGTTSEDRTNYYETFTATDENLRWALSLETDRMVNVRFTKAILDTEMTVVRNEFERGENNPAAILDERVASTAYLWHNYGKSTIGSKDDLERVPVGRLEQFYRKFYQPDDAVLVITGRIDENRTLQMVADSMGGLPRPARVLDETYTVEPPQDGERFVSLRRVGQNQNLIIAYHAVAAGHPDSAALQLLSGVMGGGRGGGQGRLDKALVESKLAQSVGMSFQLQHDPGLVEFSATLTRDQSLDAARDAIYKAIDDVITHPPTQEELERVRSQLLRSLENSLSNAQAIATGALNGAIAQGDWRLMFLQHDLLADVQAADLARVAKTYLKPSNRTVGYFVPDMQPDRTVVPARPDLAETFRGYSSKVTVARGEVFDPTIATIKDRVVRSTLANGLRLAVLSKKTANNMVTGTIELRFGDRTTLVSQREAASFAGSLLMAGTKTHTREQLQDEFRRLNAQVSVSGGGGSGLAGGRGRRGGGPGGPSSLSTAVASITAPAENFVAAVRLAVEILREPAMPQDEFDRVKTQRVRTLEAAPTEPLQLVGDRLNQQMSPFTAADAQYSPTREEELPLVQKITREDARRFHDQFYGANYGIVAVVGPIAPADVQKAASELLGSWNTGKAYTPLLTPFKKVAPTNVKIEAPDKANAEFRAAERIQMNQNDPDFPAMALASYLFGEPITSRIADRIRNREGLSYGANARITVPAEGDAAMLTGTVSLNPAFGPKVEASFMDELQKVYRDGFTAAEVEAAKKAYLDSRLVARATDAALLALLVSHEEIDRPLDWDAEFERRIDALTTEQVNAAFRRHIDPNGVTIVKSGDFKAAGVFK